MAQCKRRRSRAKDPYGLPKGCLATSRWRLRPGWSSLDLPGPRLSHRRLPARRAGHQAGGSGHHRVRAPR